MHWVYLSIAILAEVAGSAALKQSYGFTRMWPAVLAVTAFVTALFFLSLTLRVLPLGIAYAIWAGVGVVAVSLLGLVVFRQALDTPAMIGIALIVGGVIVINTLSDTTGH
ncbi:DMT family transporter [Denitrobaculum tricleocarpae]|uniref:QacE family quaternary ammonium compound efflux SMR transporter n=1 Tax=Denitrobaculum tricleocarpae TaxID=2591009 RepID=A0A545TPN1_9PROT|nr:SMR family transporter [Denitrobaculum tricleocarpae]TQV79176.1 QacE family quaternary ammonium compound efflux SMR transporter [Denitrobaculum tricleocarpae]